MQPGSLNPPAYALWRPVPAPHGRRPASGNSAL